ncbi:MAG: hypothetical protein AB2L24_17940 [Mangrovibacterium sp.]
MKAVGNKSIKYKLFAIACIYYLADLLLPMMQYYSSVYVNVFFVLVILYTVSSNFDTVKKQLPPFLVLIILTLIDKLFLVENLKDIILAFYKSILIFLPIFLSIYLISTNNYKLIRLLIITTLFFLTVTSITSIHGLIEFPIASRQLATGMKNDPNALIYAKMNIGGFTLVYMIPVILPMIVAMFRYKRLKLNSVLFFTLPLVYFVYKSQYTIAIISLLIVIIGLFIFNKYSYKRFILITFFILLFFLFIGPEVFDSFRKVIDAQSYEVSTRLNAIFDLANEGESDSEALVGRQLAYLESIKTFISSPIFGGRFFNTGIIGGHSFILDMIASYGLFGILALFMFYVHILGNFYKKYKPQPCYGYMILSFLISLFLSVLNTSLNIFVIGFFVPIVAYSINTGVYHLASINRLYLKKYHEIS